MFFRRKKGSSGKQRKKTLRTLKRSVMMSGMWRLGLVERKRRMITWSSVACVKMEESCCAVTPARHPITFTAWTPHYRRSPTENGSVHAALWVIHCHYTGVSSVTGNFMSQGLTLTNFCCIESFLKTFCNNSIIDICWFWNVFLLLCSFCLLPKH